MGHRQLEAENLHKNRCRFSDQRAKYLSVQRSNNQFCCLAAMRSNSSLTVDVALQQGEFIFFPRKAEDGTRTCQSRLKVWASIIPGNPVVEAILRTFLKISFCLTSHKGIEMVYLVLSNCVRSVSRCLQSSRKYVMHSTKLLLRSIFENISWSDYCIASSPPSQPEKMRSTAACKVFRLTTQVHFENPHLKISSHNLQSLQSQPFIYNPHLFHPCHLIDSLRLRNCQAGDFSPVQ